MEGLNKIGKPEHVSIGPQSGFIENTVASFWGGKAVDNPLSEESLQEELEEDRKTKIVEATGADDYFSAIKPYYERAIQARRAEEEPSFLQDVGELFTGHNPDDQERAVELLVNDLPKPHQGAGILHGKAFRQRLLETAAERDAERAETLARSRGSWGGFFGSLTGGIGAFSTDPLNVSTMTIGAPARAGLLGTMAIEAAIGGGTSLAASPKVQAFRKEAGLESGVGVALQDAALDATAAAVISGVIKGGSMAFGAFRSTREVLEEFDRVIPEPNKDQLAIRTELEAEADFADANPFTAREDITPAQAEAEHASRMGEVIDAMETGRRVPVFAEDAAETRTGAPETAGDASLEVATPEAPASRAVEPQDTAALAEETRVLADNLRENVVGGRFTTVTDENGQVISATDVLDEVDADDEFVEQLKVCTG